MNTRESNTQMDTRKSSLTKELQQLFKKINSIFESVNLDDRLDDFNYEKKKEIEYEITKGLATLEVQLNENMNAYVALTDPNLTKQLKKNAQTASRERVRPAAAIQPVKKNEEPVLPVDVDEMRKERFDVTPPSKKTESGHLVGISSGST